MALGTFIISFDCEGKWGMADRITPHHDRFLTEANIERAYERIVDLLARHEVPATFAFVMAFTLSATEFSRYSDRLYDVSFHGSSWLRCFRSQIATGRSDGWFAPRAIDIVRSCSGHEIACHGFSHLPIGDSTVCRLEAAHEIQSADAIAREKGLNLKTFVFPRNLIGHTDLLAAAGYIGYRGRLVRSTGTAVGKLSALAEWNVLARAQPHGVQDNGLQVIPPGNFLNWRRGARKLVPRGVTSLRWYNILKDAVHRGMVAHIWLHPHNIIDGPETFDVLCQIISMAAQLRDVGELRILTQREYCTEAVNRPAPT
jgi:peptidoglycan/xylan/chitin deacetylase (PgdA/CDA1 family)